VGDPSQGGGGGGRARGKILVGSDGDNDERGRQPQKCSEHANLLASPILLSI
jgi:hypothetical protein